MQGWWVSVKGYGKYPLWYPHLEHYFSFFECVISLENVGKKARSLNNISPYFFSVDKFQSKIPLSAILRKHSLHWNFYEFFPNIQNETLQLPDSFFPSTLLQRHNNVGKYSNAALKPTKNMRQLPNQMGSGTPPAHCEHLQHSEQNQPEQGWDLASFS